MATVPSKIDTLVIAGKHDISLLRHFFQSQEMFSKLGGRTHLFIWKSEKYLLDQIKVPGSVVIWYKDDIDGMVGDDFRNQMFIKLIADRFVDTEWFWIADADYLICADLRPEYFFNEHAQPYWFYRQWDGGVAEQRWRVGAEKYIGGQIPFLFLDEPQFLMHTGILESFRREYDLAGVLHDEPMPADCLVYGAFAYGHHHACYDWVDINGPRGAHALCYKINQRPPTYCELDENISLSQVPDKKYVVFWSYWDLAERKMRQFLRESAQRSQPPLSIETDDSPLYVNVDLEQLISGNYTDIGGIYSDGWSHENVRFGLYSNNKKALYICFEVPANPDVTNPATSLVASCNGDRIPVSLIIGKNEFCVPLHTGEENHIAFQFSGGMFEPGGQRKLYARLAHIRLE